MVLCFAKKFFDQVPFACRSAFRYLTAFLFRGLELDDDRDRPACSVINSLMARVLDIPMVLEMGYLSNPIATCWIPQPHLLTLHILFIHGQDSSGTTSRSMERMYRIIEPLIFANLLLLLDRSYRTNWLSVIAKRVAPTKKNQKHMIPLFAPSSAKFSNTFEGLRHCSLNTALHSSLLFFWQ